MKTKHCSANSNVFEGSLMSIRSKIMAVIASEIKNNQWTQEEAAKVIGVNQPRISHIKRGYLDRFSLEMLIKILIRLGYKESITISDGSVCIEIKKR